MNAETTISSVATTADYQQPDHQKVSAPQQRAANRLLEQHFSGARNRKVSEPAASSTIRFGCPGRAGGSTAAPEELGWETKRRWDATESLPAAEQSQARAALDTTVSGWVGHPVDDAAVEAIIQADTGDRP